MTALITGATSGIGAVIAEHLIKTGHDVIIFGRSQEKLSQIVDQLQHKNSEVKVEGILCDLSSIRSVKAACEQIKTSHSTIDLLILNAGLWNFQFKETSDQIEETLQVNLLSNVLIIEQLIHLLPKNGKSKVILTSSGLNQGTIQFSDLEFRKTFSGFKAYRQSKLGIILITRHLAAQKEFAGISFYCVHPGMVNTQLGRNANLFSRIIFQLMGKSPIKGAQTHNYLIDQPNDKLVSGEYYADKKVASTSEYSKNLNEAEKLWSALEDRINKVQ